MNKKAIQGFTLVDCLISLLVGSVVIGSLFLILHQFERSLWTLEGLQERDENRRLSPILLIQWLAPAGMGLSTSDAISLRRTEITARSDFDGPAGFPDGLLDSPFEEISLRLSVGSMQIRSGAGSFQPFLKNVVDLNIKRPKEDLLELSVRFANPMPAFLPDKLETEARFCVFLWNFGTRGAE